MQPIDGAKKKVKFLDAKNCETHLSNVNQNESGVVGNAMHEWYASYGGSEKAQDGCCHNRVTKSCCA
jgi:hypothetical protein